MDQRESMDLREYGRREFIFFPSNGKIPAILGWSKLTNPVGIEPLQNISIQCGRRSGLTVVDIDKKNDGLATFTALCRYYDYHMEAETTVVATPSGGLHLYYEYEPSLKTDSNCVKVLSYECVQGKDVGIDVRNDGGQVIGVGSIHPSTGIEYCYYDDDCSLNSIGLATMPYWLKNLLQSGVASTYTNAFGEQAWTIEEAQSMRNREPSDLQPVELWSPECSMAPDFVEKLLNALNPERADAYGTWIKVCWAVKSLDVKYNLDSIGLLIEWSQQSDKFSDVNDVTDAYYAGNGSIGLGSFFRWIQEDSPDAEYGRLQREFRDAISRSYYYKDYRKIYSKYKDTGTLYLKDLDDYLKGAFILIDNDGNEIWLTRNRSNDSLVRYGMLKTRPFNSNRMPYEITIGEDKIKGSFYQRLRELANRNELESFDKIDFQPFFCEDDEEAILNGQEDIFNLFKGFRWNTEEHEDECKGITSDDPDISRLLHHMRLLSNEEDLFYHYYLQYLAHIVQRPGEKPEAALVFIGPRGMGKDRFNLGFLKLVLGRDLVHSLPTAADLTRRFNKKMEGKLLTVVSEMKTWGRDGGADFERLKAVITDNTMTIEPKGFDPYDVSDFGRYFFTSNNSCPLPLTEDQRRYAVIRIDKDKRQSRDYYDELTILESEDVACKFFWYLANIDLSQFNPRVVPRTSASLDIVQLTKPGAMRFIDDAVSKEYTVSERGFYDDGKIFTSMLYEQYCMWCNDCKERCTARKYFILTLKEGGIIQSRITIGRDRKLGFQIPLNQ